MDSLSHSKTSHGMYLDLGQSFQIAQNGDWAIGQFMGPNKVSNVIKEHFNPKRSVVFGFSHKFTILAIEVDEALDLVLSSGYDNCVVSYSLTTTAVLRIFEPDVGKYCYLHRLGHNACLAGEQSVRFLDLVDRRMIKCSKGPLPKCERVESIV